MIPRLIEKTLERTIVGPRKIILLLGARQVGKTTLLKQLQNKLVKQSRRVLYLNCDLEEDLRRINTQSITLLTQLTKNVDYVLIDEAQHLYNPGLTLKIIHDNLSSVRVITTGSSSLDLKNRLSDPLIGRLIDFHLYPISLAEIIRGNLNQADFLLDEILTFGLYPEVYLESDLSRKRLLLTKLIQGYLFKDILAFQKVRHPQLIQDLTRALSYQVGSEVNENELANRLKIDRKTVVNYLDLLEKTFVLVRVFPFSKNPRREIGKNYKIYFVDLGIRNALIGDFNLPKIRVDLGSLWENFLVIERLKKFYNQGKLLEFRFWRTYGGAEVDFLEREIIETKLRAFEFKYGKGGISRGAKSFNKEYKIPITVINQENYLDFII